MIRINLLPPEYRQRPSLNWVTVGVTLAVIILPLASVGMIYFCLNDLASLRREIASAAQERAQYGPIYDKVVGMEKQVAEIQAKLESRLQLVRSLPQPLEILGAMEKVAPANVSIGRLSIAGTGTVSLAGTASDYYGVAALHLKMLLSEEFADIDLRSATARGEETTVNFDLTANLKGLQSAAATPGGQQTTSPAATSPAGTSGTSAPGGEGTPG